MPEQLMFAELVPGEAFTFDHDTESVVYRKTGQREYELVVPVTKRVGSRTAPVHRAGTAPGPHPICPWCDEPVIPGTSPFVKAHWPCLGPATSSSVQLKESK